MTSIEHWHHDTRSQPILEILRGPQQLDTTVESTALIPADTSELQAAQAILAHRQQPWIDMRSGPLAPRHAWRRLRVPAMVCATAAAVLLITAITLLGFRTQQYNGLAAEHDQQARQAFTDVLPGQTVPTSPQRRLATRLKQLRGEQGLAAGDEALIDDVPLLVLLHEVLTGLPADQRFAITDLRLEDGELRLTGQARSHGEADRLANSLRTRSAFIIEPPSTDTLAPPGSAGSAVPGITSARNPGSSNTSGGGVRFTIVGAYRPPVSEPGNADSARSLAQRETEASP